MIFIFRISMLCILRGILVFLVEPCRCNHQNKECYSIKDYPYKSTQSKHQPFEVITKQALLQNNK